jgi:cold shock protein
MKLPGGVLSSIPHVLGAWGSIGSEASVALSPGATFPYGSRLGSHGRELNVATGTIKWFDPAKGYGFIQPDDGSGEVFVHVSAVESAGHGDLREGQRVSYNLEAGSLHQERNVASALRQANAEVGAFQSRHAGER